MKFEIREKIKNITNEINKSNNVFVYLYNFKFYPYLSELTIMSDRGFGSVILFQEEAEYILKNLNKNIKIIK